MNEIPRLLEPPERSFFLFGARGTGKSTWLRQKLSHAIRFDLLDTQSEPPRVVCIETKLASRWDRRWERPMRDLASQAGIRVEKMIGVYTGSRMYHYEGLDVLPVGSFLQRLHSGDIF